MIRTDIRRHMDIIARSVCDKNIYSEFLKDSFDLIDSCKTYLAPAEDINSLELAHLVPEVAESMLAIYLGINDAVCNKGLVTALLPQHGHNNVFVFDPQVYSGSDNVPQGTIDAKAVLAGFEPPNTTWNPDWTYVMISDPARSFSSLWQEKGYIDTIPAKFEDFTMMSDHNESKVCVFISDKAFSHPVNAARDYLNDARDRGNKMAGEFIIPEKIHDEFDGLVPVVLHQGEKLYVATTDMGPCAHGWTNIHPDNQKLAVVNENSAVPMDLVINKPPVNKKYAEELKPPMGSADMTTDWFKRGSAIWRKPVLQGTFKG
ncbi:MAG: hypothetical protein ACIAQZ_14015 [Sedimentisphaeraceae bacterium JB056]